MPTIVMRTKLRYTATAKRLRAKADILEGGPMGAVPALIRDTEHSDWRVRRRAVEGLDKAKDPSATPCLIKCLDDPRLAIRMRAAHALGENGDESAVSALAGRLGDKEEGMRLEAARALGKISGAALPVLERMSKSPDQRERRMGYFAILHSKYAAKPDIARDALRDRCWRVRLDAVDALMGWGPAAVPHLVEALGDRAAGVRKAAAAALGSIGDASAIAALCKATEDRDFGVRMSALSALGEIGHPSALPALRKALENRGISECVAHEIVKIRHPSAIPLMIELERYVGGPLFSPLREKVDAAICSFGKAAIGPLSDYFKSEKHWEISHAAYLLGMMGEVKFVVMAAVATNYHSLYNLLAGLGKAIIYCNDPEVMKMMLVSWDSLQDGLDLRGLGERETKYLNERMGQLSKLLMERAQALIGRRA